MIFINSFIIINSLIIFFDLAAEICFFLYACSTYPMRILGKMIKYMYIKLNSDRLIHMPY